MTAQQPYDVVEQFDTFELRRYPEHLVAQVEVGGTFDAAGSKAFGALFGYITGANESRSSIAMTAPVTTSQTDDGRYVVAFVLPATMTEQTASTPTNPGVQVRVMPESFAAVVRYSGRASVATDATHLDELTSGLSAAGLTASGAPHSARFDAPRTPGFLRRNEVVQPVESPDDD